MTVPALAAEIVIRVAVVMIVIGTFEYIHNRRRRQNRGY